MATLLKTSRTQVDRLPGAKNNITLSSIERGRLKDFQYGGVTILVVCPCNASTECAKL